MHIHYQKTSGMTIGTRQRIDGKSHLDIKADNTDIRSVSNQKLLGLHIDENLNWNTNIDYLCKIVTSKVSLLRQLAKYVPMQFQKRFYQGYILPLLDKALSHGGQHLMPILKGYQNYRNEWCG